MSAMDCGRMSKEAELGCRKQNVESQNLHSSLFYKSRIKSSIWRAKFVILNLGNKKCHAQSKSLNTKSTQLDVALCKVA